MPPPMGSKGLGFGKGKKKLNTPLAAMLPSKYENLDVTDLFPDFRPDKVKKKQITS